MKKVIFFAALCLLMIGVYIARVEIVQNVTPMIAAKFGVQVDVLEIKQLSLNRISIKKLNFSQQDVAGKTSAEINDIEVEYKLSIDVKKIISAVVIKSVVINHQQFGHERQSSSQHSPSMSVKHYAGLLPVYDVDIRSLVVMLYQDDGLLLTYDGSVQFAQSVHVDGVIKYRAHEGSLSLFAEDEQIKIIISDADSDNEIINLAGEYNVEDDWLKLRLNSDYAVKNIDQVVDSEAGVIIQQASGEFDAVMEVDIRRRLDDLLATFAADVNFDLSAQFSSELYDIQEARVDVRAQCIIASRGVEKCIINQPQKLAVSLNTESQMLGEFFNQQVKQYHIELNPNNAFIVKRFSGENNSLAAEGGIDIYLYPDAPVFKIQAQLPNLKLQWAENDLTLSSEYHLSVDANRIVSPVSVRRVKYDGRGNLTVTNKEIVAQINHAAKLALFDIEYQDMLAEVVELQQLDNAQISYNLNDEILYSEKQKYSLNSKRVKYSDVLLNTEAAIIDIDRYRSSGNKQLLEAKLSIGELVAKEKDLKIIGSNLLADINLNNDDLKIDGDMQLGVKQTPLKFRLNNNMSFGIGRAQFESKPIPLSNNEVVAQIIGITGFPLQLRDGSFTLRGNVDWSDDYQDMLMTVDMSAKQVDGDYAQNPFVNLNVDISVEENNGWVLSSPTTLTIESLNVGIPLNDITMRIEEYQYGVQAQPSVKVVDFYANTLEGSVFSEVIDVDLNRSANEFSLYLSALSLEKLVELNQTEDLLATGIINGVLPMKLNDGVLEIDNGNMKADENGGFIKYGRVAEVLSGNDDLKLVAQLLKDFQYNKMSALVNLSPDGALSLQTKLYGHSPDAEFDSAVNLNFNIDLNLWKFLESARLLTRIGQDITQQITAPQSSTKE